MQDRSHHPSMSWYAFSPHTFYARTRALTPATFWSVSLVRSILFIFYFISVQYFTSSFFCLDFSPSCFIRRRAKERTHDTSDFRLAARPLHHMRILCDAGVFEADAEGRASPATEMYGARPRPSGLGSTRGCPAFFTRLMRNPRGVLALPSKRRFDVWPFRGAALDRCLAFSTNRLRYFFSFWPTHFFNLALFTGCREWIIGTGLTRFEHLALFGPLLAYYCPTTAASVFYSHPEHFFSLLFLGWFTGRLYVFYIPVAESYPLAVFAI